MHSVHTLIMHVLVLLHTGYLLMDGKRKQQRRTGSFARVDQLNFHRLLQFMQVTNVVIGSSADRV